jgi:hypothetical protein
MHLINKFSKENENTYWKIARKYEIEKHLRSIGSPFAIQGEIYGEGLQGNPLKLRSQRLAVFSIYDVNDMRYYDYPQIKEFCDYYGLEAVKLVEVRKGFSKEEVIDSLLNFAEGKSSYNENIEREGLVWTCIKDNKERIIFKTINNNYLLKHEK